MSNERSEMLRSLGAEYDIDYAHARSNGDRMLVAITEQIIDIKVAQAAIADKFAEHCRVEGIANRALVPITLGVGLCNWGTAAPAIGGVLEWITGRDLPPVTIPVDIAATAGGFFIIIGLLLIIGSPGIVKSLVDRIWPGK